MQTARLQNTLELRLLHDAVFHQSQHLVQNQKITFPGAQNLPGKVKTVADVSDFFGLLFLRQFLK